MADYNTPNNTAADTVAMCARVVATINSHIETIGVLHTCAMYVRCHCHQGY